MIRTNKGFTLIELMVVIVIIGVLAALAIPKFTDASTKAKFGEIPTVMASYDHAQLAYLQETGEVGVVSALVFDEPSGSKWFSYDGATTAGTYTSSLSHDLNSVTAGTDVAETVLTVAAPNPAHDVLETTFSKYLVNFDNTP